MRNSRNATIGWRVAKRKAHCHNNRGCCDCPGSYCSPLQIVCCCLTFASWRHSTHTAARFSRSRTQTLRAPTWPFAGTFDTLSKTPTALRIRSLRTRRFWVGVQALVRSARCRVARQQPAQNSAKTSFGPVFHRSQHYNRSHSAIRTVFTFRRSKTVRMEWVLKEAQHCPQLTYPHHDPIPALGLIISLDPNFDAHLPQLQALVLPVQVCYPSNVERILRMAPNLTRLQLQHVHPKLVTLPHLTELQHEKNNRF